MLCAPGTFAGNAGQNECGRDGQAARSCKICRPFGVNCPWTFDFRPLAKGTANEGSSCLWVFNNASIEAVVSAKNRGGSGVSQQGIVGISIAHRSCSELVERRMREMPSVVHGHSELVGRQAWGSKYPVTVPAAFPFPTPSHAGRFPESNHPPTLRDAHGGDPLAAENGILRQYLTRRRQGARNWIAE
jgi:hypothetical protein